MRGFPEGQNGRLPPPGTAEALSRLMPGAVEERVDLARHSHWRIGGTADIVVRPRSVDELSRLYGWLAAQDLAHVVIGGSTNLLFSDEGLRAICVEIGSGLAGLRVEGNLIFCEPGAWAPHIARGAMQAGLTGIEHICGIPGTIGGLVYMNGGSQRHGIGEAVVRVVTIDPQGRIGSRTAEECGFRYRHSIFQETGEIVAGVELNLTPGSDPGTIRREMLKIMGDRRRKFPHRQPSCGSVFVSNPAFYAEYGPPGAVIERMGFKGLREGGAQVSPRHANFIVNTGGATARDVLALIQRIRQRVAEETGYVMEVEARFVSSSGRVISAGEAGVPVASNNAAGYDHGGSGRVMPGGFRKA
ncbi:UDP-N-acetylmuramate dehydrogenase [Haematobacter missouriensis]|nr:UDP-N-acetylmuramate dehydrogenase [Haematobacter missouriensis]KFI26929.1 UDP-N-acetylmuramate dehydrogenase [Haematobacter missouriensis]